MIDVGVGAWLAVAAERFLQRLGSRCSTQSGIAVDVVCADRRVRNHALGVVLLEKELPGGVEADRSGATTVQQVPAATYDFVHRRVPVGGYEFAVSADQRFGQSIWGRVCLPAEEVLRVDAAVVDAVGRAAAHTDD